jgi:hypothetical protein
LCTAFSEVVGVCRAPETVQESSDPIFYHMGWTACDGCGFVSGGGEYTISGSVPRALNPALITSVIEFAGASINLAKL